MLFTFLCFFPWIFPSVPTSNPSLYSFIFPLCPCPTLTMYPCHPLIIFLLPFVSVKFCWTPVLPLLCLPFSAFLHAQEFDKPNEDVLRHHASISELKRNFMESVPESRPSEWDKRLSTHSPFRTLGINGQPLPSADGVSLPQLQYLTPNPY